MITPTQPYTFEEHYDSWIDKVFYRPTWNIYYDDTIVRRAYNLSRQEITRVVALLNLAYYVGHVDGQTDAHYDIAGKLREQYESECG